MFVKIKQVEGLQAALDAKLDDSQLSIDTNLGLDDAVTPSQNAVKTYVDGKTTSIPSIMNYSGTFDALNSVDFSSLNPGSVGDSYKVISDGNVLGIDLYTDDFIVITTDTVSVTAVDIVVVDNTETSTLIRTGDTITDDTLLTGTVDNIPTSQTVVDYVDSIVNGVKEQAFLERTEEFTSAVLVAGGTLSNFNTLFPVSTDYSVSAYINGVELIEASGEFGYINNSKAFWVNPGYDIDTLDTITLNYKTLVTLIKNGENHTSAGNQLLRVDLQPGQSANYIIGVHTFVLSNNGGSLQIDSTSGTIEGSSSYTVTLGETVNLMPVSYQLTYAADGSFILEVVSQF